MNDEKNFNVLKEKFDVLLKDGGNDAVLNEALSLGMIKAIPTNEIEKDTLVDDLFSFAEPSTTILDEDEDIEWDTI